MDNVFKGISVLALAGVILLFALRGNQSAAKTSEKTDNSGAILQKDGDGTTSSGLKIAYVRMDSLVANYEHHKELKKQLEQKYKSMEADMARRTKIFEENYRELEKEAKNLSPRELQAAEAELMAKQQELVRYRDSRAQELLAEEAKLNAIIKKDLDEVIDDLAKEFGLDLVFTYDAAGTILYGKADYDITAEVVKRLNDRYAASRKK
ncbi:MAG: OmpH family outer membrane protein [Thermaurantimonas sp.]|uniref:OmpH family outer membrane protein n=1 Tax=Thermaurantimonas sp. TaxID=2681568 RepID=UPI00391C5696